MQSYTGGQGALARQVQARQQAPVTPPRPSPHEQHHADLAGKLADHGQRLAALEAAQDQPEMTALTEGED